MANIAYSQTVTLDVTGITPTTGPKPAVIAKSTFSATAQESGDYYTNTLTINASTGVTVINIGKITAGKVLWIQSDGPLEVTMTQDLGAGDVDNVYLVRDFLMVNADFTVLKLANPSATTGVQATVAVIGDRPAIGGGAGIF